MENDISQNNTHFINIIEIPIFNISPLRNFKKIAWKYLGKTVTPNIILDRDILRLDGNSLLLPVFKFGSPKYTVTCRIREAAFTADINTGRENSYSSGRWLRFMTSHHVIATDPLRREKSRRMNGNKQEILCPIVSSRYHITNLSSWAPTWTGSYKQQLCLHSMKLSVS